MNLGGIPLGRPLDRLRRRERGSPSLVCVLLYRRFKRADWL